MPQRTTQKARAVRRRPPYASYVPYEEIGPLLRDLEARSERLTVEVIGRSAGGRELYLAVVRGRDGRLAGEADEARFRALLLDDPVAARRLLGEAERAGRPLPLSVWVNAGVHGGETTGTDAALRVLRRLALEDDPWVDLVLSRCVVHIAVCHSPDGRVTQRRVFDRGWNAARFDLNRDMVTLSQPESRALAGQLPRRLPAVFFDLHGFYGYAIVDCCTPPHNPCHQQDLIDHWSLPAAEEIEAAIKARYEVEVQVPGRDWSSGWEDYSPTYVSSYPHFYAPLSAMLETTDKDEQGVGVTETAITAVLAFASRNASGLQADQVTMFERDLAPARETAACVVPVDPALQPAPAEARRALRRLRFGGGRVERASTAFSAAGVDYPAGTFVVPFRQPLGALAEILFWRGEDLSKHRSLYDTCAWNLPELWGFDRALLSDPPAVATEVVTGIEGDDDAPPAGATATETIARWRLPASPRVAVADRVNMRDTDPTDVAFVLDRLGFDVSSAGPRDELTGFDVLIGIHEHLSPVRVADFVRDGGGYIGIGRKGVHGRLGDLLQARVERGSRFNDNGVVRLRWDKTTPLAASFDARDYGFVFGAVWFRDCDPGVTVHARLDDGEPLLAGWWRSQRRAAGAPIVVSGALGAGRVVYLGLQPMFRDHTRHTFRLLADAIGLAAAAR